MTFSFFALAHPIFAQSSQSWCLSLSTDQELSKTVLGNEIWTKFDGVTALQRKRAFFLGHPVLIHDLAQHSSQLLWHFTNFQNK